MRTKIVSLFFASALLLSCNVLKKKDQQSDLNYMQNIEQIATEASVRNARNTLQIGDQLVIMVTAKDMDVVKPFNQNYSSGEILQYSMPSSNMPAQGQTTSVGPTYIIDSNGDIDFPVVGKLNTSGKTLEELKAELRGRLTRYVINPTVSAKLTNYRVTVLGEVNKPGTYVIPDGQSNLLSALGLAGDLTMYGKRDDVLLVRNVDGNVTKERINIKDANFINSPFYYLKQGDVIYVSSNETKEKTSRLDPNMPIYISAAGIVVTILALVFKK